MEISVGSLTSTMDHRRNRIAELEDMIAELEHSAGDKDKLIKLYKEP